MTTPSTAGLFDDEGRLVVMPSVYSLAFPETNAVFDAAVFPPELFSVSATEATFNAALAAAGLGPLPAGGERKLGLLDLVHEPILAGIVEALSPTLPGLGRPELSYRYPLHGSSAGIGLLLGHLKNRAETEIWTLLGDYEGYAAQAANFGLGCRTIEREAVCALEGGSRPRTWFISSPSAIDGESLVPGLVEHLIALGDRVVVDVAYHGLQGSRAVTAIPAGTWAVLWSLSKPWGLFWRRVGMLCASEPIPGAYGTRWFKDPARLLAAYRVVSSIAPGDMADRYRVAQRGAVRDLASLGVPATPSSTVLLAHVERSALGPEIFELFAPAERIKGTGIARVCLTPLMERWLAKGAQVWRAA